MIVLINIVLPLLILGVLFIFQMNFDYSFLKKIISLISIVFGLFTIPLIIFDYHYYNWNFEYLKTPVFLVSLSLILTLLIGKKYFKQSIISLLILAFMVNLGYQFILQFAGMGGRWEPKNCPDFNPPISTNKNYSIIKGNGFFIHETKLLGLVYKEQSHVWSLSHGCRTIFHLKRSGEPITYDSCKNELIINK